MKLPKARQLPSGSWLCRVYVNGRSYNITRSTEKEAVAEALAIKNGIKAGDQRKKKKTLTQAIDAYIEARTNVLSPATIRGYRIIQANRFQAMMQRDIHSVTQEQWQQAVNTEARKFSSKTLVNSWRFVSSVITEETGRRLSIRLPQVVTESRPWLTPEEIQTFIAAIHGSSVEIPALLALSSLRSSELLNLRWKDIDLTAGVLHVNGSAVFDSEGNLVRKRETKNKTSRRAVPIITPLAAALAAAPRHSEYVVTMTANGIYKAINRICAENGLPAVGIHGLRHSFASLAYHLNLPEKVAMEIGGWADNQTMHKIYTHISQQQVADHAKALTAFFDQEANI